MALHCGDCFEVMQNFPDNSVDLVLTDPPYGLKFMGKKWDYDVPPTHVWFECLRVLKPGGHLLCFAGTRTQHRMACRIEDAGFEIRDMIAWVYGSGFPKSLDVSKAIDKAAGAEREVVGKGTGRTGQSAQPNGGSLLSDDNYQWPGEFNITTPATEAACEWDGWGTALKPALEPITMARKPLVGTVAANVLEYGTGALNIDACRVEGFAEGEFEKLRARAETPRQDFTGGRLHSGADYTPKLIASGMSATGRWPANLIHDGSEEATKPLRSAARFFYCAKASKAERGAANNHPTIKPIALIEYLVKLASREGQVVLDPFMGSGTTGIACRRLNREFIGIEREPDYLKIAESRIGKTNQQNLYEDLF